MVEHKQASGGGISKQFHNVAYAGLLVICVVIAVTLTRPNGTDMLGSPKLHSGTKAAIHHNMVEIKQFMNNKSKPQPET